jgi:glycine cleavage system H lipoate-binding protein
MVAIFVLLTIIALIAVDVLVTRRQPASETTPAPRPIDMRLPAGRFLHPGHGWAQIEAGGRTQIGVDGFVRGVIGAADAVEARPEGAFVRQGEPMLSIERGGRKVQVPAPLSGRIEAVNPELWRSPGEWGHTDGWAYTLRPAYLGTVVENLRVAEAAGGWLRSQADRLRDWFDEHPVMAGASLSPMPVLPDGGEPAEGALAQLDDAAWADFEKTFLPEGSSWSW